MIYLAAILVPPLYFLIRKRYAAFFVHGVLCTLAVPLMFVFGLGLIPWVISVVCAVWDLRKQLMKEHAEMVAASMVGALRGTSAAPGTD